MLRKRYCTLVRFKTPQTSLLGGHRHQINLVWPRETESSTAVWNTTLWPFTLLTWVFTGSVFTSIPPADTVLGATPPNSTEPYRTKTSELDFHPKVKYKEQIHVTNWSNSSVFHCTIILYIRHIICWYLTHTHTHKLTYPTQEWATDLAGADLSVDVCLLSDAVLQVRDVGLEPVPVADDSSSLHGVAALCPLPSRGQMGDRKGRECSN